MKYVAMFFFFLLILLDKLLNVLLLGSPHKTLSMRLSFVVYCKYVKPRYKWVEPLAELVDDIFDNDWFTLDKDHIYKNYEAEEVLSDEIWKWYIVTHEKEFQELIEKMKIARFEGRV